MAIPCGGGVNVVIGAVIGVVADSLLTGAAAAEVETWARWSAAGTVVMCFVIGGATGSPIAALPASAETG